MTVVSASSELAIGNAGNDGSDTSMHANQVRDDHMFQDLRIDTQVGIKVPKFPKPNFSHHNNIQSSSTNQIDPDIATTLTPSMNPILTSTTH